MTQRVLGSGLATVIGRALFDQSRQQQGTPRGKGRPFIEFIGQADLVAVETSRGRSHFGILAQWMQICC